MNNKIDMFKIPKLEENTKFIIYDEKYDTLKEFHGDSFVQLLLSSKSCPSNFIYDCEGIFIAPKSYVKYTTECDIKLLYGEDNDQDLYLYDCNNEPLYCKRFVFLQDGNGKVMHFK